MGYSPIQVAEASLCLASLLPRPLPQDVLLNLSRGGFRQWAEHHRLGGLEVGQQGSLDVQNYRSGFVKIYLGLTGAGIWGKTRRSR